MKNVEKSDEKQRKFKDFSILTNLLHSWGVSRQLEAAWRRLWAVQRRLGDALGSLRGVSEAFWRILERLGDVLEASWGILGASWTRLGKNIEKRSRGITFWKDF